MIRIALLLTVVGSLAVALATNGTAAPVRLTATVGPGYTITLKKGTKVVRTLKRGKYASPSTTAPTSTTSVSAAAPAACSRASAGRARDDHARAQAGPLHVRLRPARRPDARQLPRHLAGTPGGGG
jgi:hypothetical protein